LLSLLLGIVIGYFVILSEKSPFLLDESFESLSETSLYADYGAFFISTTATHHINANELYDAKEVLRLSALSHARPLSERYQNDLAGSDL